MRVVNNGPFGGTLDGGSDRHVASKGGAGGSVLSEFNLRAIERVKKKKIYQTVRKMKMQSIRSN